MSDNILRVGIAGHVTIEDDLGNVLLEKSNAIHPQNMSRIIARALSNEPNSTIYKLALGNGGTYVDATGATSFRRPNDGIAPDLQGWQSRLYNETYNEVVDEGSALLGQGVGAFPGADGIGIDGVRSLKLPTGESQVVVTCVLNSKEPTSQISNSLISTTNGTYTFDELGLFTAGLPHVATQGYQDVVLSGGKSYTDLTYLTPGASYYFEVTVDGTLKQVVLTMPAVGTGEGGKITYTDLKQAIDTYVTSTPDPANPGQFLGIGLVAQVSQPGVNTLGNLRFRSIQSSSGSAILITDLSSKLANTFPFVPGSTTVRTTWLFPALKLTETGTTAYVGLGTAVTGQPQGEEDNAAYPQNERERMLTHLIFSPLQKDASRSWKITYKLTVIVQQSDAVN